METTCTVCAEKSKGESALTSCPVCGASLEAPQKETVLKRMACRVTLPGDMAAGQKGALILTNQRIFWIGDPSIVMGRTNSMSFAIMNNLSQNLLSRPKEMRFSLGLDEVSNIEILKKGLFRVLTITASSGGRVVPDIKSNHRQEWIDAVNDAKKRFASENG